MQKIRKRKSIDDLPPFVPCAKAYPRDTRFALSGPRLRTQCPIPTCYPYARSVFTRRNDPAASRTGKTGKPGGSHFLAPFPQTLHSGGAFRLVGQETLVARPYDSLPLIRRGDSAAQGNQGGQNATVYFKVPIADSYSRSRAFRMAFPKLPHANEHPRPRSMVAEG